MFVITMWLCAAAIPANAHDRITTSSIWKLTPGRADVLASMSSVDATSLAPAPAGTPESDAALARHVAGVIELLADGRQCSLLDQPHRVPSRAGRVNLRWSVVVPPRGELVLRSELFEERGSGHLHFATVKGSGASVQRVLSVSSPTMDVGAADEMTNSNAADGPQALFLAGVHLVSSSPEHWLLLVTLVLTAAVSRVWPAVKISAAFLLGCGLAYALVTHGIIDTDAAKASAASALTLVLAAAHSIWRRGSRDRITPGIIVGVLLFLAAGTWSDIQTIPAMTCIGIALVTAMGTGWNRQRDDHPLIAWVATASCGLFQGLCFAQGFRSVGKMVPPVSAEWFAVGGMVAEIALAALVIALVLALGQLRVIRRSGVVLDAVAVASLAIGMHQTINHAISASRPGPAADTPSQHPPRPPSLR